MLPSIERTDPARTLIVPRVGPPATRSRLRFLLPWLVFGAVAVVVIAGTTLWSVALRTSGAGRATPDAAGIGTGAAPGPLAVAALPTTPAAATVTVAALTSVRSPVPRPRAVAPPPAPARPAAVAPTSVVPPPDPAPTTLPDLAVCAEPGAEPPACVATSAPGSRSAARATGPQQRSALPTDTA